MKFSRDPSQEIERELGGVEKQFHRLSQEGAGGICCTIAIEGQWPVASFGDACEALLELYPRLRLGIVGTRFQLRALPLAQSWTLLRREDDEHWRRLAERELTRRYPDALFHFHVLDGDLRSEILLSLHHSLADGMSAIALFQSLWAVLSGEARKPLAFGPALEARLPPAYTAWRGWLATLAFARRLLREAPREEIFRLGAEVPLLTRQTESAGFALNAELSHAWRQNLRAEGAHLLSGLAAAIMLCLMRQQSDKRTLFIGLNTPVSLRESLRPVAPRQELGLFISGVLGFYQVEPEEGFYALARKIYAALQLALSRGDELGFVRLLGMNRQARKAQKDQRTARLRPSFSLSNSGVVPSFPALGAARMTAYHSMAGLWPHDALLVTLSSYEGVLQIEILSSLDKLGAGYAQRLAHELQEFLRRGPFAV